MADESKIQNHEGSFLLDDLDMTVMAARPY
jgi:hypothetical protein